MNNPETEYFDTDFDENFDVNELNSLKDIFLSHLIKYFYLNDFSDKSDIDFMTFCLMYMSDEDFKICSKIMYNASKLALNDENYEFLHLIKKIKEKYNENSNIAI